MAVTVSMETVDSVPRLSSLHPETNDCLFLSQALTHAIFLLFFYFDLIHHHGTYTHTKAPYGHYCSTGLCPPLF